MIFFQGNKGIESGVGGSEFFPLPGGGGGGSYKVEPLARGTPKISSFVILPLTEKSRRLSASLSHGVWATRLGRQK